MHGHFSIGKFEISSPVVNLSGLEELVGLVVWNRNT
jgi:hypothetical protein